MAADPVPGTMGYADHAPELIARYERISPEEKHRAVFHLIPTAPSRVLDLGAGTGADAAWLAGLGHQVVAVEPTLEFRRAATALHPSPAISWLDDALPGLAKIPGKHHFDLVMATAVWMHLDEAERAEAMARVAALLRPSGTLILSLRHGRAPAGRRMFPVSADETVELASRERLECVLRLLGESIDAQNRRAGVLWSRLAFTSRRTEFD